MFMAPVTSKENRRGGLIPALLDDGFLADFMRPGWTADTRAALPPVDVSEYKDKFVLEMDIPGMEEKDLKIEVNDGALVIEGMKTEEKNEDEGAVLLRERTQSAFKRRFMLGDAIETDRIEAVYRNGTLKLTIPKSQKAVPRVVPISVRK